MVSTTLVMDSDLEKIRELLRSAVENLKLAEKVCKKLPPNKRWICNLVITARTSLEFAEKAIDKAEDFSQKYVPVIAKNYEALIRGIRAKKAAKQKATGSKRRRI